MDDSMPLPNPPMSHTHTKLLDRADDLPVMLLRQLRAVVQVSRDKHRHDIPQDLLKEYSPGEMIHGHVSLFNIGMSGSVEIKNLFVVMEGKMEYQRLNGEKARKRVLRMDMDVVEAVSVPTGSMFDKSFAFVVPDRLIGRVGEEEVLVELPPTLGNRETQAVVGEEGFAVGNGMGGPVVLNDLSNGVLVEYRIRLIAIGVHGSIVGEAAYPVRIVPSWRRSDGVPGKRPTSVGLLMRKTERCIKHGALEFGDVDEKPLFGQVQKEVELNVRNWGATHRETGMLSISTVKSMSVGYSTAPMIEKFNGIATSSRQVPVILHYTGPSPPKITCITARLQVYTISSSLPLPIKIKHHHLSQINSIRRTFTQYQQHLSEMNKVCPHLERAVNSLASLEKRCITSDSFPMINATKWINTSAGWTLTAELSTHSKETLVPDFQLESIARLYMIEIVVEMKRDRLVMRVPLTVTKQVSTN